MKRGFAHLVFCVESSAVQPGAAKRSKNRRNLNSLKKSNGAPLFFFSFSILLTSGTSLSAHFPPVVEVF